MSGNQIDRRRFLKIMGWSGAGAVGLAGCDMPTTVTLEEGKEEVLPYVLPEEFNIPGIGVWYASTCGQCSSGCGVHGRVREGRVLKLEGNPGSPISGGKICQMGQAGLQSHYNPDRLKKPMVRKGGNLVEATWEEALQTITDKSGKKSGVEGSRVAWLTGQVSGHQRFLLQSHLDSFDSVNHYAHEIINNAVSNAVNKEMFGEAQPVYQLKKAALVVSFGADLVGVSQSPVLFSREYADFRSQKPRGKWIQIEPKMSLTGSNADLWLPVRPGTEGVLAMGIANELINKLGVSGGTLPPEVVQAINNFTPNKTAEVTGLGKDKIVEIAKNLKERSPSLVLAGATTEGHSHGYEATAAVMMLNVLLGNVGKTITASGGFPEEKLAAKTGSSRDLLAFAEAAEKGTFDVVFITGTNPVYTAPKFLKLEDKLGKIPFKVVVTQFYDETAHHADVVLPLASALEDWGTHVPSYQAGEKAISVQQPLMEKLYADTRGLGDVLLELLKIRRPDEFGGFADYYAYLQTALEHMPEKYKGGQTGAAFWQGALQKGMIPVNVEARALEAKAVAVSLPGYEKDTNYPMHLVPAATLRMWDGRHANLPWLQEAPDQISKVVWGSWAEIHPRTAAVLGVKTGDFVSISSAEGSVELPVYVYRGVHPDVVAVPMGQGHEHYGRYAKGRGVNPLKLVSNATDKKTGELALYGTRVRVAAAAPGADKMVRFGGSETQMGRKLAATIPATVFNRTEGA